MLSCSFCWHVYVNVLTHKRNFSKKWCRYAQSWGVNRPQAQSGEIVGEIAFLDGGTRTATGRAAQPSTCFMIQRAPFMKLLKTEPQLTVHLLELVCQRVRWTSKLVADSAFLSVPERLASRLTELLATEDTDAYGQFEVRLSQIELAHFLGVSRQVVNGHLQRWQKQGFVTLSRGSIVVHDLSAVFGGGCRQRPNVSETHERDDP